MWISKLEIAWEETVIGPRASGCSLNDSETVRSLERGIFPGFPAIERPEANRGTGHGRVSPPQATGLDSDNVCDRAINSTDCYQLHPVIRESILSPDIVVENCKNDRFAGVLKCFPGLASDHPAGLVERPAGTG